MVWFKAPNQRQRTGFLSRVATGSQCNSEPATSLPPRMGGAGMTYAVKAHRPGRPRSRQLERAFRQARGVFPPGCQAAGCDRVRDGASQCGAKGAWSRFPPCGGCPGVLDGVRQERCRRAASGRGGILDLISIAFIVHVSVNSQQSGRASEAAQIRP